ncbi:uncharacterized protein RJT20DRAFT_14656 [Scheffersomyces xylosifermentans]|uniref:uncharacterized protein n=1 Tax=Scheffersomyces xylosifermentans TaxID=1304137 RepID=UPI00315D6791
MAKVLAKAANIRKRSKIYEPDDKKESYRSSFIRPPKTTSSLDPNSPTYIGPPIGARNANVDVVGAVPRSTSTNSISSTTSTNSTNSTSSTSSKVNNYLSINGSSNNPGGHAPPISPSSHTQNLRSLSTPPPSNFTRGSASASPSLTTLNSMTNGIGSHSAESDKLIKASLKQYKKLEIELNKFNSRKYNHSSSTSNSATLKGNILRTSLLPFLRTTSTLDKYFPKNSKIYKSLTSVIVSILIRWWSSLLGNLTIASPSSATSSPSSTPISASSTSSSTSSLNSVNSSASGTAPLFSAIPASDRNAYLECISRIVTRDEWNSVDMDMYKDYESLLVSTLDYCIVKMSTLKIMSLSFSAFTGKIFAYSFFKLPDVSNALLFLLNVKQIIYEKTQKLLDKDKSEDADEIVQMLYGIFPEHLHYLIKFNGISNLSTKGQKMYINCTPPPKHPVNGIKDPNGNWVRRWCNIDSNVFNSFFRHYVTILQNMTADTFGEKDAAVVLRYSPGFQVILSHVVHIFQISVSRISTGSTGKSQPSSNISMVSGRSNRRVQNGGSQRGQGTKYNSQSNGQSNSGSKSQANASVIPPPPIANFSIKQSDVYYNSIIKIFKTLRDVVYWPNENDCIVPALVKYVDRALIATAEETSVYDYTRNGLILTIVNEFINHVHSTAVHSTKSLIDWEFWLSCNYMMITNTDHIQILLKNLAFLFNVWDMVPETLSRYVSLNKPTMKVELPRYCGWMSDLNESIKYNFITFLISNECFERFVTHWNPIVRSYYLRLLVWRIIGINNYQSSIMIQTTKKLQEKINKSYEVLHDYTVKNSGLLNLNFKPDNPLVNRKFGILPINVKDDYLSIHDDHNPDLLPATPIKSSELRKTHPYEVFDEAIYTCSTVTVPLSPDDSIDMEDSSKMKSAVPKNSSLVNSIGKLFRILSIEDENAEEQALEADGAGRMSKDVKDSRKESKGIRSGLDKKGNLKNSDDRSLFTNGDSKEVKRNNVSFTSLSTAYSSLKSRSSSPSSMSFRSTPTSVTESSSSDSDSNSSSIQTLDTKASKSTTNTTRNSNSYTQPPELARLPPEIVRPIYKFDIIMDHDSMNDKYSIVNNQNSNLSESCLSSLDPNIRRSLQPLPAQTSYFPICPRIPLISIFINSDSYNNKFLINDEEGLLIENVQDKEGAESSISETAETRQLFRSLRHNSSSHRDLIRVINLGRSLNELNSMNEEFKHFLNRRIEIDKFNQEPSMTQNLTEYTYFKKIIPFLSVDSSNELKMLNAN